MNQVNLAEIRLGWIGFDPGPVLDGRSRVSISLDPKAGDQLDGTLTILREGVRLTPADSEDLAIVLGAVRHCLSRVLQCLPVAN
jgi:hypothetical protein